ncbi:MAG: hypothetical protein ACRD18_17285 [Terriglobia bacterium]
MTWLRNGWLTPHKASDLDIGAIAEFAASSKKGAHIHITGYQRSREIEKPVNGKSKKSGVTMKVLAWEVRAIRIVKLDRAVQEDPSIDVPTGDPAL